MRTNLAGIARMARPKFSRQHWKEHIVDFQLIDFTHIAEQAGYRRLTCQAKKSRTEAYGTRAFLLAGEMRKKKKQLQHQKQGMARNTFPNQRV